MSDSTSRDRSTIPRFRYHQITGVVTSQAEVGRHRPIVQSVVGAAAAVVLTVAMLLNGATIRDTAVTGLLGLLTAPLQYLGILLLIALGLAMITYPARRRRGPPVPLPRGITSMAIGLARMLLHGLRVLWQQIAGPRVSTTFWVEQTSTSGHPRSWQIRLLAPAPGLLMGQEVTIDGLALPRTPLLARRVHITGAEVSLRPATWASTTLTSALTCLALTALLAVLV